MPETFAMPKVAAQPLTPGMYGAVGDGATDDTAALQTLLYSAQELNRPINLEGGNYKITEALFANFDVTILGQGRITQTTIRKPALYFLNCRVVQLGYLEIFGQMDGSYDPKDPNSPPTIDTNIHPIGTAAYTELNSLYTGPNPSLWENGFTMRLSTSLAGSNSKFQNLYINGFYSGILWRNAQSYADLPDGVSFGSLKFDNVWSGGWKTLSIGHLEGSYYRPTGTEGGAHLIYTTQAARTAENRNGSLQIGTVRSYQPQSPNSADELDTALKLHEWKSAQINNAFFENTAWIEGVNTHMAILSGYAVNTSVNPHVTINDVSLIGGVVVAPEEVGSTSLQIFDFTANISIGRYAAGETPKGPGNESFDPILEAERYIITTAGGESSSRGLDTFIQLEDCTFTISDQNHKDYPLYVLRHGGDRFHIDNSTFELGSYVDGLNVVQETEEFVNLSELSNVITGSDSAPVAWSSGNVYASGDRVTFSSVRYVALEAVSAGESDPSANSKWNAYMDSRGIYANANVFVYRAYPFYAISSYKRCFWGSGNIMIGSPFVLYQDRGANDRGSIINMMNANNVIPKSWKPDDVVDAADRWREFCGYNFISTGSGTTGDDPPDSEASQPDSDGGVSWNLQDLAYCNQFALRTQFSTLAIVPKNDENQQFLQIRRIETSGNRNGLSVQSGRALAFNEGANKDLHFMIDGIPGQRVLVWNYSNNITLVDMTSSSGNANLDVGGTSISSWKVAEFLYTHDSSKTYLLLWSK